MENLAYEKQDLYYPHIATIAKVEQLTETEKLFEIELPDTVLTIYVCKMSVAVSECQP